MSFRAHARNPLGANRIIQAQELMISKLQGFLTLLLAGFRDDTLLSVIPSACEESLMRESDHSSTGSKHFKAPGMTNKSGQNGYP